MDTLDIKKTLAVVALICKEQQNLTIDLYELIKKVYLADRKSFVETFRPITDDLWVNMQYGPVNSTVYDLAKGEAPKHFQVIWDKYFSAPVKHLITMIKEPELDVLTGLEVESIKYAVEFLKGCNDFFSIRDKVHALPEYKNTKSSEKIDLRKILKAEYPNITDTDIKDILEDLSATRGIF